MNTQVLIVGAGPTGLVLALWLNKLGVRVRIVEKAERPSTASRALAVQARTLELYRQLGLGDTVAAAGHRVPAVNLWTRGRRRARVDFDNVGAGLTRYPFLQIFPQDAHERLLTERLHDAGVEVERGVELTHFSDDGLRVAAHLRHADGKEEVCEAGWLAGCDGAGSTVRHVLEAKFPGGTYSHVFYVADIEASGPPVDGELHVALDEANFLAIFPLVQAGRVRLVGVVEEKDKAGDAPPGVEHIGKRGVGQMRLEIEGVNWFSTYHVHHRVAAQFRKGRAFLLGDAAHVHSPVGGQGMNTGIQDAINLAWKLASVLAGRAGDSLLDSYETERIAFARRLVATTDRAFTHVTAEGPTAAIIRTKLAPAGLRIALLPRIARRALFRTVSQITLNYRDMPLSTGRAGRVAGGDRLPWVEVGGIDNHVPLPRIGWQVHVYGKAEPALARWCEGQDVPLHVFGWDTAHGRAGLMRDALYLLRPDTYVALAAPSGDPAVLARYFADRGLSP